jgi:GH15 family glucan-1,4-alpha-glucosidase
VTPRIEDYALLGDLQTAALVSREGSVDWLCVPRFDAGACFAALLGDSSNGRWLVAPVAAPRRIERRYRDDTLVLETEFETDEGTVRLIDFMPPRGEAPDIVRIVEGVRGTVRMHTELVIRFDYGRVIPWMRRVGAGTRLAIAGPDAVSFRTPVDLRGENMRTVGEFDVAAGNRVPFVLTWYPSHQQPPHAVDAEQALRDTDTFWRDWAACCTHEDEWHDDVHRSLIVLKALTYAPTGGIVAAPTTSLPEQIGGVRNWDYRYCWLRDATLTLLSLLNSGYVDEAKAWRDWLLRAVAGDPADLQIMYGIAGERRLTEWEIGWLPGFAGSRPVRIGNAAAAQRQLDVYGEVIDALNQARRHGLRASDAVWSLSVKLVEFLETAWHEPDEGIWEVRGPRRHFTHSKVMAWVAFDRMIRATEEFGRRGPVKRWRAARDALHAEICAKGFDPELNSFTQTYGSKRLDASLLLLSLVGFLPANDPRMIGTVAAVQRELSRDGLIMRYRPDEDTAKVDGLPAGEGVFLPCSFWLADNLALQGRVDEARALFERLLSLRNDVGLLAEEYDPDTGCQLGNFPQAFSHVALINTAYNLSHLPGPLEQRHATRD